MNDVNSFAEGEKLGEKVDPRMRAAIEAAVKKAVGAQQREMALDAKSDSALIEAGDKAMQDVHEAAPANASAVKRTKKSYQFRIDFETASEKSPKKPAKSKKKSLSKSISRTAAAIAASGALLTVAFPKQSEAAFAHLISAIFAKPDFNQQLQCSETELIWVGGTPIEQTLGGGGCNTHYKHIPVTDDNFAVRIATLEVVEGDVGSFLTLNPEGLARAIKYFFKDGIVIGGTGPDLSALEFVATDGAELSVLQKLGWISITGPIAAAHLAPTVSDRQWLAVNHLPCLRGIEGYGRTIQRLSGGYCNLVVGKEPGEPITSVEACVIAVTPYRQFRVPGSDATEGALDGMDAQFALIKQRADDRCLTKLWMDGDLEDARVELAAIERPDLDFILSHGRPRTNPFPGAQTWLAAMTNAGRDITLDASAQIAAENSIKTSRDSVLDSLIDVNLCVAFGGTCSDEDQVDIMLMLAEPMSDGTLAPRVAIENRPGIMTHTGHAGQRSFASTVKPLVVPLIIQDLHRDGYKVDLCKQPEGGLRDANRSTGIQCSEDGAWLSLEGALAESSNLAFNYALKQLDEERLRAYLIHLGFYVPEDLTGFALRRALLMGDQITISADALMRAYSTIALGRPMNAPMGLDAGATEPLDLSGFVSEGALNRTVSVLAAPVHHPRGTARSVAQVAAEADCTVTHAKTGTADAIGVGLARDRVFEAVVRCGDRELVVFALVGAPTPERILGTDLSGRHINEMAVRAAIAALKS